MTLESLLGILREFNVSISLSKDNNRLILDGTEEIITQYLPNIGEHKPAIIELLKRKEEAPPHHDGNDVILIRGESGLHDLENFIYASGVRKAFIDCETNGLDPFTAELVLIQLMAESRIYLIDVGAVLANGRKASLFDCLWRILEDENILKVFHNALFDLKILKYCLFNNNGIRFAHLFDTMLAEDLLTAGLSKWGDDSLQNVVRKYLNISLDKGLQTSFKPGQALTEAQIRYAADDVRHLEKIFEIQSKALVKAGLTDTALLEFSIIPAMVDIELAGVHLDTDKLQDMKIALRREETRLEQQLDEIIRTPGVLERQGILPHGTVFNYRSPVQIKKLLHAFGFDVSGTGIEIIEKIDHPFARTLVEYRRVSKLLSAFVDKLPKHVNEKTGRIHPKFLQLGAATGRFSCQRPNLQQIPKEQEWRDLFSAPEGRRIITADYSQIELRILTELSQDPNFLHAYRTGQDLHRRTAAEMFKVPVEEVTKDQRGIAKTINFGICYGLGAKGLSERLNIPVDRAESFINQYFRAYPHVKSTLQALGMKAVRDRCSVTLGGRKRYYLPADSFSSSKALERKGRNTPIQGTCGDIFKKAILYLSGSLKGYDAAVVNIVHDEIVIEVTEDQAEAVRDIMRRDMIRAGSDYIKTVPVEVDVTIDRVWRKEE
jgi:DNA polymerase I